MPKERFSFGKNWGHFLKTLDEERIIEAEKSLKYWLELDSLSGMSFLDIGSGSGLFSLAAKRLGATVHSFDYDEDSVKCTRILKERYYKGDNSWTIEQGDALSKTYLDKYELHDIVYSWGVLHHTGDMYKALDNAGSKVKKGGKLFVAIYNDQGSISNFWKIEKRIYNRCPEFIKVIIAVFFFLILWILRFCEDLFRLKPGDQWKQYKRKRGMSPWHDAVDWVGGYPFEVAKPEDVFEFFHKRGFELIKLQTKGGKNACNQFVFKKNC